MADMTVNNNVNTYAATAVETTAEKTAAEKTTAENTAAKTESADSKDTSKGVVYEKSTNKNTNSANKIYNKDAIVSKLKADQQARIASMQSLVESLLGKQRNLFDVANLSDKDLSSMNLAKTFRGAAAMASPDDILKAQQDISEDGYWGVNQTSDRLVSMAIALSGGDTEKADEMMAAIEKGYKIATKAWGEDLPQICQDTMAATRQKMSDWKNGVTTAEDYNKYLK